MTRPTETSATPQSGDRKAPLAPRPHRDAPGAALELMQPERSIDLPLLTSIIERAFAQTMHMIFVANTRKDKRPGDPKVGGHPASCASSIHILAALHLVSTIILAANEQLFFSQHLPALSNIEKQLPVAEQHNKLKAFIESIVFGVLRK